MDSHARRLESISRKLKETRGKIFSLRIFFISNPETYIPNFGMYVTRFDMYIPNFGMIKSSTEKHKNHSYPKLFETASLTYFRSEKKRKTSFSFAFLSLNRNFAREIWKIIKKSVRAYKRYELICWRKGCKPLSSPARIHIVASIYLIIG